MSASTSFATSASRGLGLFGDVENSKAGTGGERTEDAESAVPTKAPTVRSRVVPAADPFLITGPALISFSGGRTSAYMLWRILQAHGGALPDDVIVVFANTGKEDDKTLRFVHECAIRWGVQIVWLEWRDTEDGFEEVGFNSASRSGEPFEALCTKKGYLPNAVTAFCSIELKGRVMKRYAQVVMGWKRWEVIIGLRHDEGARCLKAYARNAARKEPYTARLPLDKGRVTERDVLAFWLGPTMRFPSNDLPRGFDLGLYSYQGNCDNCMKKRREKLIQQAKRNPESFDWWMAMEARAAASGATTGAVFRAGDSYATILRDAEAQTDLFASENDDEHDTACDLLCGEAA